MANTTLTSLAMLKVHVDRGQDYLDYLRPFILHVLARHKPATVKDVEVRDLLRADFGLVIPERAVQVVLKRVSRGNALSRQGGLYRITGALPDPEIDAKRADAKRHINAVASGLIQYSEQTPKPIETSADALEAICTFLARLSIPCLRAYLRGTTIPDARNRGHWQVVLVSKYVLELQDSDPERFDSFVVVLQGHMLANALLCPDLEQVPKSYRDMTFYLDTPLLIRHLGLAGEPKQAATTGLVELLLKLGARVATFSHLRDELKNVVRRSADFINTWDGRGTIVMEARQRGITKSDLLLVAGRMDDRLKDAQVEVLATPKYGRVYQIDEQVFENVLDDEVSYMNPRAKENDINSVRSVYTLRSGLSPGHLERARAALVTSNSGFASAAFEYGKQYEESREVSSVITDFSLANMAWLKGPLGAPDVPMTELLAFSYAALQPSRKLLTKYMREIDKLEEQGKITATDHQVLRSGYLAHSELMGLTLGDEAALTQETVLETVERATNEIKKKETARLEKERGAHRTTRRELEEQRNINARIKEQFHRRCDRQAKRAARVVSRFVIVVLLLLLYLSWSLESTVGVVSTIGAMGVTIWNWLFGTKLKDVSDWVEERYRKWRIGREEARTGLDLTDC